MAQYYWEADGGDVGGLPTNATVTQPWHSWDSLSVEASSAHADFSYALKAVANSSGNIRRVAAFSDIDGNSLTQSGVTQIYGVVAVSRTYLESGLAGRISGDDTSETAVIVRYNGVDPGGSLDFMEYDNAGFTYFQNGVSEDAGPVFAIRMEFDGSTVKIRTWDYDATEPGTWDYTDTVGVTGAGDWGLHAFSWNYSGNAQLLALGFGNSGDAAPTEPVSGDGNNVTPSTGSITQTGLTPATEHTVQAVIGALSETGMAPTVTTEGIAEALPGIGALYESGLAPTLVIDNTIAPETGVINTEGLSPEVGQLIPTSEPQIGVISVSGNVVTIGLVADLTPEPGRMRVTGLTQSAGLFTPVYPAVGSLAMVGYNPQVDTRIWVTDGEAPDGWTQDGAGPDGWSADAAAGTSWTPS